MIAGLATELGPWTWWIAGLVFLGLEILVPGVFLLWIGLAAIVVGALSFLFWGTDVWSWQLQLLLFAVLLTGLLSSVIATRAATRGPLLASLRSE